jgi:hypothetical protein
MIAERASSLIKKENAWQINFSWNAIPLFSLIDRTIYYYYVPPFYNYPSPLSILSYSNYPSMLFILSYISETNLCLLSSLFHCPSDCVGGLYPHLHRGLGLDKIKDESVKVGAGKKTSGKKLTLPMSRTFSCFRRALSSTGHECEGQIFLQATLVGTSPKSAPHRILLLRKAVTCSSCLAFSLRIFHQQFNCDLAV